MNQREKMIRNLHVERTAHWIYALSPHESSMWCAVIEESKLGLLERESITRVPRHAASNTTITAGGVQGAYVYKLWI